MKKGSIEKVLQYIRLGKYTAKPMLYRVHPVQSSCFETQKLPLYNLFV